MKTIGSRSLRREFAFLRSAVKSLDNTLKRVMFVNEAAVEINGRSPRKRRLSPKARASLVLQGRYMGFMRQLKPRQKAQVRKIRETKGVRAAIARARRLSQSNNR